MQQQRSKLCVQRKHLPQALQRPRFGRLSIWNPHKVFRLHSTTFPPSMPLPPSPPCPGAPTVREMHIHLLRRRSSFHPLLLIFPRRRLHHNVVVPDEIDADRNLSESRHRVTGFRDGEGHKGGLGDGEAAVGGCEEGGSESGARSPLERDEGWRAGVGGGEAAPKAEESA